MENAVHVQHFRAHTSDSSGVNAPAHNYSSGWVLGNVCTSVTRNGQTVFQGGPSLSTLTCTSLHAPQHLGLELPLIGVSHGTTSLRL